MATQQRNVYILPAFDPEMVSTVKELGLRIGPIARREGDVVLRLTRIPMGWTELSDYDGRYLVDERGRRRIQFMAITKQGHAYCEPEVLRRFAIQEWWPAPAGQHMWYSYVRTIQGNDKNIYRFPDCAHTFKTTGSLSDKGRYDACKQWLDERYPDWEDRLAYWDQDIPVLR